MRTYHLNIYMIGSHIPEESELKSNFATKYRVASLQTRILGKKFWIQWELL